mgnify:CR=1 FL=1
MKKQNNRLKKSKKAMRGAVIAKRFCRGVERMGGEIPRKRMNAYASVGAVGEVAA